MYLFSYEFNSKGNHTFYAILHLYIKQIPTDKFIILGVDYIVCQEETLFFQQRKKTLQPKFFFIIIKIFQIDILMKIP